MPSYRKPDGVVTQDVEEWADAWKELGTKLEPYFPGYKAMGFDPSIWMEKWEGGKVLDRFILSVDATNRLLETCIPKQLTGYDPQM